MNCNQVFNILTRGPFPTGDPTDASVEIHLATCSGCRRLAEALRPALEVFQEAVAPEECGSLPGYWGELAPAPGERAVSTAARTGHQRRQQRRRAKASKGMAARTEGLTLWQLAIAATFGLLIGVTVRSSALPQREPGVAADNSPAIRSSERPASQPKMAGGRAASSASQAEGLRADH